tara:strand:+ start:4066 stop:4401 length:336 start_codon:yes stop_codon:yes gene_type:complete
MVIYLERFFKRANKQIDYALFTQGILLSKKINSQIYVNLDSERLREFRKNPNKRKQFEKLQKINCHYHSITWHYNRSLLLELRSKDEDSELVERLTNELKYHPIKFNTCKK